MPTADVILDDDGKPVLGPERSARQVIRRLTSTWRWWGERHGYFASEADARAFEDELGYMLVHQMAAPNSPQWFNTGLHHAYGLTGPAQGFWYVDPVTGRTVPSPDSYSRPAPHACFIQSIEDDLVNEGGIMDLWVREARLFKFGAGTGTNFSRIRAENEPLSGGGRSSGVMSFLRIGDRAAGAIKSGGTTRRAAKMVILDIDHPDIEEFINWKKREEDKVRALIAAGYPSDFNGEAYQTVSGQNANNSVRVSHDFMQAVVDDADWDLTARTDGQRDAHRQGAPPVADHRRGRLGLRRPGGAVRRHHQRVAHLPRRRADPGLQPVLRVHVPRQHRLQPGQPQPGRRSSTTTPAPSTSRPTSTPSACGPWCSTSR